MNEDKEKENNNEENFDEDRVGLTYNNLLLVDVQNLVNIVDSTFYWMINVDTSVHVILTRDIFCSYTPD